MSDQATGQLPQAPQVPETPKVHTTPLQDNQPTIFIKKKTKKNAQSNENQSKLEEEIPQPVSFKELLRFASKWDLFLLTIGALCAIAHGSMLPLFTIFFGDTLDSFGPDSSQDALVAKVGDIALQLTWLALGAFVASFLQIYCLTIAGQNQANRIRQLYMKSVLSQEMAWYDHIDSGQLTARVVGDVNKISDGIGDKLGSIFQQISMFMTGFVIGFVYGWKLTLVVLSVTPLLVICGILANATNESQTAYAEAGAVAAEALSLIRTVVAFGGEPQEKARYDQNLVSAYKVGAKRAHITALAMGIVYLTQILIFALAFWYGNRLAIKGEMSAGQVLTVFLSIVIGAMAAGQAAPAVTAVTEARGAAPTVYAIIDRTPQIDSIDTRGNIPTQCEGKLTLANVHFTYPARPDTKILHGLSLDLQVGKATAFVGESGCGKSTVLQLMSRFYDPQEGSVSLDGKDLRTINVQWLRSQTGLVSQTPTLFKMTVAENIAFGAGVDITTDATGHRVFRTKDVSKEDIIAAAKAANAHKFIMKLPEGYDTRIGERGAMLSGGQKQRIAIARALIRDPKILLFDEATSALDTRSEKVVQDALESAQKGRTTIIIAHRLSTVKNADLIVVFGKGHIKEQGTHEELMKIPDGAYRSMVEAQQVTYEDDPRADDAQDPDEIELANEPSVHSVKSETHQKSEASISHHILHLSTHSEQSHTQDDGKLDGVTPVTEENKSKDGFGRVLAMNKDEWYWIVFGLFGAAVAGVIWPIFAFVFSEIIAVMGVEEKQSDVGFWSLMFVALGVAALVGNYAAEAGFNVSAEKLTMKLRSQSFEKILYQEIGYFDKVENSVGALCQRLSSEAQTVSNLSGSKIKMLTITLSTIISGVIIAFTNCWKLAFVVFAFIPVIGIGAYLQLKVITGFSDSGSKMFAEAGQIANEAIDNIRTASALVRNEYFYNRYCQEIHGPLEAASKKALVAGLGFGFTEFVQFIIWAVAFYYGSKLTESGECDFLNVMNAITALLFGAMTLGEASARLPDVAEGASAANRAFTLLDRESKLDVRNEVGERPEKCQGHFEFTNLEFEYPSRPDVPVLRGLTVDIQPGRTLALVGESGCGKSTLIALTERFYDIRNGSITLDGNHFYGLNVKWLRSRIGIVSQEPDLFDTTIRDNILYGLRKDESDAVVVTDDLIINAAKQANAHDFISALPEGYDTKVGERGNQLSGGQKQRVAIARALIRDPTILLLDEATAALDVKSEKVVQEALDAASKGRTTIVVAHRLSTIRNADKIAVVARGVIVECGTDVELIARKGAYALLVESQTSQK